MNGIKNSRGHLDTRAFNVVNIILNNVLKSLKMKILTKRIFAFLLIIVMLGACTEDFEEVNNDPNRPKEITPGVVLEQLQYRMLTASLTRARSFTHNLMQVDAPRSSTNGGGVHRYIITPGEPLWETFYLLFNDLEDIISIAEDLEEDNYKAIALVYKAWAYSILTDLYGDIPYSEATKAIDGNFSPSFDTQKDIYIDLLNNLELANSLFDESKALTFQGDLLYDANQASGGRNEGIVKWKKFGNSLRLRLLLRISKRDGEVPVSEQINAILSSPTNYPVFESNADEAILRFPGTFPYFNPYFNARTLEWRDGTYFTHYFLDSLNAVEDPRREVWVRPIEENGELIYRGIESGYLVTTEYNVGANSSYRDELKTDPKLGIMMTYAELEFIKAELAIKGFATGGTAKAHYDAGITASMVQWEADMPNDFLQRDGVAFNESASEDAQLEQIIQQKYYAYVFVDYQAWFEKRRTGYPVLPRGTGILPESNFPSRVPYPTYLQSLNPKGLQEAVSRIGGDNSDIKVWWDK
ncbi:SusD/RagB family nutrient-binding outer membrane lipoprotein [Fulvivirga sp.]|uniref:SusD/RagB family nutrient-binding outer membrane lipoprotein n=1 Tax=Fulvivirga sp. TaxID=1931237 RepID=UPI0032F033C3